MKYFLIRFNTRLIKRIDLKQGAFISNCQKEEIHESAQMIRRHPADRNTAAHTLPGGQRLSIGLHRCCQHPAHLYKTFTFPFHAVCFCIQRRAVNRNELEKLVLLSLLMFLRQ